MVLIAAIITKTENKCCTIKQAKTVLTYINRRKKFLSFLAEKKLMFSTCVFNLLFKSKLQIFDFNESFFLILPFLFDCLSFL